jgi:hypothetical protein
LGFLGRLRTCGEDANANNVLVFPRTHDSPRRRRAPSAPKPIGCERQRRVIVALRASSNAQSVQYVKICSLYGAGFYYIPGTDTCLKVGGYVRTQIETGANGGGSPDIIGGTQGAQNRYTNNYGFRARGHVTFDTRSQTSYGTLRSYITIAAQNTDNTTDTLNMEKAFIQFAGFTIGVTSSFFDFLGWAAYGYHNNRAAVDTGAVGIMVFGYTAQFGNGLSASISAEDHGFRTVGIRDVGNSANDAGGNKAPDFVANLRVDQAWGSAQIMAGVHQNVAGYYGATGAPGNGHPDEKWGYAIGGGVLLNVPGMAGDKFGIQGVWSKGAASYASATAAWGRQEGTNIGIGTIYDAVFGTSTATPDLELTTVYNIFGVYEHKWQPNLKTSVYAGYVGIDYNGSATSLLCASVATCNPDFAYWQAGTRTEWSPVANLNIGIDVLYTKLDSATSGVNGNLTALSNNATATNWTDMDVWTVMMRWQRNFWP